MMQVDLYMKFIPEMPGQCIRSIHAPVLTARTATTDRQTGESPPDIILYRDVDDIIDAVQEFRHPRLLFQEVFHGLVTTRLGLEFRDAAGIQDAPAIEYKASPIAAVISGYAFPV